MSTDEIILEIEDSEVVCKKQLLIRNSDYFRVMFENDFREQNMSVIKLKDVELRAMQVILTILNDESHTVLYEDILMVLQVASMLQFLSIVRRCVNRVSQVLSTRNCLEVWLVADMLSFKYISLKAKYIALNDFMVVRHVEFMEDLSLKQFCDYVGNVHLRTDSEYFVFETVMEWWYKNSNHFQENSTEILLKLLSCIDYPNLSVRDLNRIINYPDILANNTIIDTMKCLLCLKNGFSTDGFSESIRCHSTLLNSSKSRCPFSCPCILVTAHKKAKARFTDHDNRQRDYLTVKKPSRTDYCVIYYDKNSEKFKKFFDIDNDICRNLEGFKLLAYGGYVLMYGGQYIIGSGEWNYELWTYDFIREQWNKKCRMPYQRSHFKSCIAKGQVFILGGIGNFRIRQENFYYYDISKNRWSNLIPLPSKKMHLKCCVFMNEFVACDINDRCAYYYTRDKTGNSTWTVKNIIMDDSILNEDRIFELVSHKDKLYIKGKNLIEFGLKDGNIEMLSVKNITNIDFDALEVIVCCDAIYTLYKYHNVSSTLYTFEKYNFETGDIEYIFRDRGSFEVDGECLEISSNMKMFSIDHYSLLENNDLINRAFL